jgi:hypothetical protein
MKILARSRQLGHFQRADRRAKSAAPNPLKDPQIPLKVVFCYFGLALARGRIFLVKL